MKVRKLTGVALATAAAGLFAVMAAGPVAAQQADSMKCEGVNGCKGKSDCKTDKNACKGQNGCKGKGFQKMSKADCDKATAEMKKKS